MIRRQVEPVPAAGARSPPIGDSLRQQREQLGWSLDEVAGWLRIRRSYLQALEDGRPDALPAGTYTIGFLRSYAVALGLDPQTAVERFRRESSGHLGHPDLSFPSPVPERGVPAGAAILLGVVLLIGAYAGWYVFSARDSVPVQAVPEVPDAMLAAPAPAARPAVAPGPGTPAASNAVVSSPVVPAPAVPAPAASAPAASGPAGPIPQAATVAPAQVPAIQASVSPPTAPQPAILPNVVKLKALATTWVQVRKADGTVLYDHLLAPGDTWAVPEATPPLQLTTGNAGGLALAVGNAAGPALGWSGAVLRHVSLDAAAVRALNAELGAATAAASRDGHTAPP